MQALSEPEIRASFINTSVRERKTLTVPSELDAIEWDQLDYLGWRDPKSPGTGLLVTVPFAAQSAPIGIMLRAGAVPARTRPQCALCQDISLPNEVVLFGARRAGSAGRRGDTIGSLICADFECSRNVRRRPSSAMAGDDPERVRRIRIQELRERVARFVARVGAQA
ncbi:FBP domain-containing protein [Gordonia sp. DT30]|uniref:FBP domain-containing protein n=1 Tax=Gordonia sp. DT30 TaxID=3416546 RepID=UPI003CEB9D2B